MTTWRNTVRGMTTWRNTACGMTEWRNTACGMTEWRNTACGMTTWRNTACRMTDIFFVMPDLIRHLVIIITKVKFFNIMANIKYYIIIDTKIRS